MVGQVTLMTVPYTTFGEANKPQPGLPQFLLEQDGIWRDMSPPLWGRPVTTLSELRTRVEQLLQELMRTIDAAQSSGAAASDVLTFLEGECNEQFYQQLIPQELQEELRAAADAAGDGDAPVLRIHTEIDWIPWEILHDGVDFLGLRFQVARVPVVPTKLDMSGRHSRQVRSIYNLLGQNVLDGEPLFEAWESTFSGLVAAPVHESRFPPAAPASGGWPSLDQVVEATRADIIHFTCHGGLENTRGQVFWTLNHNSNFPQLHRINSTWVKGKLGRLRHTRPLVFGNACSSARESGLTSGFGSTFFQVGALAFVGTFAPITKTLGIAFACRFYEHLLRDKLPIGKALWATKRDFRHERADPSWLFYCLYGLPDTCFELAAN